MAQAVRTTMTMAHRVRSTIAEVNAGKTLVAAVPGMKHRIVDFTLIAIGGAAAAATSVDINGTRSSAAVKPAVVAVAALTQSAAVKPDTANVTLLADGASFTALDENTAITIGIAGSDLTTATHIDAIIVVATEKA